MKIPITYNAEPSQQRLGKTRLLYKRGNVTYAAVISGQFLTWPQVEAQLIARGIGRSQAFDAFVRQERI